MTSPIRASAGPRLIYTVLMMCSFISTAGCQPNASSTHKDGTKGHLALVGGNIIDGTGGPVRVGWSVLIHNERIDTVGLNIEIPAGAEILELNGRTIMPGLVDMHGHLYANVGGVIKNQFDPYPSLYLAGGVTTIFSPGDFDPEGTVALRDRIERGETVGPRILTAGPYFDNAPSKISWIQGVSSPEEALDQFEVWRNQINAVKVYTSITEPQLEAIIRASHAAGFMVTGHLTSVSAGTAIELGINGLEHGIFGMPEFWNKDQSFWDQFCSLAELDIHGEAAMTLMDKIVENNVFVDPTTVALQSALPDFDPVVDNWETYLSAETRVNVSNMMKQFTPEPAYLECLTRAIEKQNQFIGELHRRGGLIVAGTDPVAPQLIPGYGLHREIQNLVEAGLTPLEAIKATTYNASVALKKSHIGTIEAGKLADIMVVEGDPSITISDIGNVVMVFKAGRKYDPVELRKSVQEMIR